MRWTVLRWTEVRWARTGGPEIGFWFCRVDSSVAWYGNGENWKLAAMR